MSASSGSGSSATAPTSSAVDELEDDVPVDAAGTRGRTGKLEEPEIPSAGTPRDVRPADVESPR